MSEKEYVEVTLKLPKVVAEFYKALTTFVKEDMEAYLTKIVSTEIQHIIDEFPGEPLIKRYGLMQCLRETE